MLLRRTISSATLVGSELLFGTHSVAAALASGSRTFERVTIQLGDDARGDAVRGARALAPWFRARRIPVVRAERSVLDALARGGTHQGVVAHVSTLALPEAVDGLDPSSVTREGAGPPVLLALDGITDPQNVGAIMRTALLLGVDGIVLPKHGGAPVNATLSKTSAGALEVLAAASRVSITRSLPTFLGAAAAAGWRVLAAGGSASGGREATSAALPIECSWETLSRDAPTVLVLGSEGAGLSSAARNACTAFVNVPMSLDTVLSTCAQRGGDTSGTAPSLPPLPILDSFNVSVAAALLLSKLTAR